MMPVIDQPLFWLLATLGLLLTGISKSGFAGGAGVLAVPLLALIMPVGEAVTLCLPLLLVMDARAVLYFFRDAHWPTLARLLPAATVGIALGGVLLNRLPDQGLQLTLGMVSLLFASWPSLTAVLGRLPHGALFWGGLSGLTSTLLHAGGPPLNIYLLSIAMDKRRWLATAALFFAAMNLIKIVPYSINGQWQFNLLLLSALLSPIALIGVWLGYRIQQTLAEKTFMRACRVLLFLSGALLLVKAV